MIKKYKKLDFYDKDMVECRFYGLGSDGTVSANKNSIKIISEYAGYFGQAYFVYARFVVLYAHGQNNLRIYRCFHIGNDEPADAQF